jgi:hypothetical protein
MAVEILSACLVLAVLVIALLLIRVAILRNNLKLFGEKLKEIEKQLTPKHKLEEKLDEQANE